MRWLLDAYVRWRYPGWLLLLCCSCAGSLEAARPKTYGATAAPPSERCITLDDRRAFWGASAKTYAVLGGGAGLATIATDDNDLRMGLAIGSVAAGAFAAGAVYVSEQAGNSWTRECSTK